MSRAAFLALVMAATLGAPRASAAVVSYGGSCARTTDVVQWTPRKGAIARFVADTFASSSNTGLWIGLGASKTAFWSAEGGDPNDACDDCRTLYLVETKFDGTRTRHTVLGDADLRRIKADPAARKAHVLGRLWKLAEKTWPAGELAQDYTLTTGKPPAKDRAGDPSFMAKIRTKDGDEIRYDLGAKTSMCWCVYEWKAKKG